MQRYQPLSDAVLDFQGSNSQPGGDTSIATKSAPIASTPVTATLMTATATASPSLAPKQSDQSTISRPPGGIIFTAMLQNGDNLMPISVAMDSCASHSMVTEVVASQLKAK